MEPSAPLKFGLAIFQVGFGFAILVYGSSFAGPDGKVAVIWLALMYLFHTTGELCLSPVGLAMVTRLSVSQVSGMMMGVWFLSSSFAAYLGGVIAGAMAIEGDNSSVSVGLPPKLSTKRWVLMFGARTRNPSNWAGSVSGSAV